MESLELSCPLCCNETFASKQSLKYHLLSITDNIICTICNERFETIFELANHFDKECESQEDTENDKSADSLNVEDLVSIKIEAPDEPDEPLNDDIKNSILARALLRTPPSKNCIKNIEINEQEIQPLQVILQEKNGVLLNEKLINKENNIELNDTGNGSDEQSHEIYSCSSCGVSFTSIVEHIEQHHDGQEIVLEMFENEQGETEILTDLPEGATILENDTSLIREYVASYDDEDENMSNESHNITEINNKVRMPQILNTLKQEDCVDKDGRLYTRKVVQIEKFWDDEPAKSRVPIILKFIVDTEGAVTKIKNHSEVIEGMQTIDIFQCSYCNVQFSKRKQYDVHICDPEVASEYQCPMCNSCFTSSQSLCAHMKVHKPTKKELVQHYAPTGPFICNVCETVFPSNKSLRLHRRMHDPIKNKEIEAPVEYSEMGEEDNSKPREMFECTICNKFYDKSYESIHLAYHSGVNHYDCQICNRKFYTKTNLEMHMRVHGTEKGHICAQCKKGFLTEESLKQHLKQHCSDRPYQCSYCTRRFARPHEKVKHERIHTGEKPHECEICGKTFRVSYCLTLHMRTHSGYRPYVCQHCGKRFKAHSVYNHHLLTHSDVRGYKCPYCPKAFKTGVQLAGHKNSHTKPFSCIHCNRPFASLYAVRAHMETHKRENNLKYNCYLCGASYARAFALRDHIKEQHLDATENGTMVLDVIEEGMEASTSILPDSDDINMVTSLEDLTTNVTEIQENDDNQPIDQN